MIVEGLKKILDVGRTGYITKKTFVFRGHDGSLYPYLPDSREDGQNYIGNGPYYLEGNLPFVWQVRRPIPYLPFFSTEIPVGVADKIP